MGTDGNERVPGWRWTADRVRAHWHWGRTQGWGRLVEEDQLDPRERLRAAVARTAWRRRHGLPPGTGVPVLVVGLQRSGTNMLLRGLERSPAVEVHNENDRDVFDRFRLRDERMVAVCHRSRHSHVLFKPLCDSHRTPELLALAGPGARAVWIYRDVDARVRSSLAKFGDHNRDVLVAVAAGTARGTWQQGGLDDDDLELLRSLDPAGLDAASASALFWYLRNNLLLRGRWHERTDVHVTSYDNFLGDPEGTMRSLCAFLGLDYGPELVAHVRDAGNRRAEPLPLEPRVRALCDDVTSRLAMARQTSA